MIPGSGRSPGGEHSNPLQYSCLEKPMDRGTWQAIVHRVAKSQTRLSDCTHMHTGFAVAILFVVFWLFCNSFVSFFLPLLLSSFVI